MGRGSARMGYLVCNWDEGGFRLELGLIGLNGGFGDGLGFQLGFN